MSTLQALPRTHISLADAPADQGGVLKRIALALNSSLDVREVLRALAGETLSLAGAGRTSVFLYANGLLHAAASRAAYADEELWDAFRHMDPIPLTADRYAIAATGKVVVVDDPRSICPPEWVDRFDLRCLVLVPLLAGNDLCGLMSIDFPHQRRLDASELALLQAIGTFAGVAVRNARTYEAARRTARLQAGLAEAAAALALPLAPAHVAGRLCAAAADLLGVRHSGVVMLDLRRGQVTPLMACGTPQPDPFPIDEVPPALYDRLHQAWTGGSPRACVLHGEPWLTQILSERPDATVIALPLRIEGHAAGAAMFSVESPEAADPELVAAAEALAAIAGAALERHMLLQRQQQQVDRLNILYGLSTELAERADAQRLVDSLNAVLRRMGFEVEAIAFRSRVLVRHLGGDRATAEERAAWATGGGKVRLTGDILAIPMRLGRQVVGSLRVRATDPEDEDIAFLEALAAGVAEVATRGALRSSVEEASRERAVTAERERIAADLHDSVGQQFVALGLMANRLVEHLPASSPWTARVGRLAQMASGGKFAVDQAVRALAFVPAARRGLVPAIRGLCRLVAGDSGLDITVDVSGRPVRLAPPSERALYRVVHEALTNSWRHARCATVHVQIAFATDAVSVTVRDDGIGLGQRTSDDDLSGNGVWSMRRTVAAVDGKVHVRDASPRGTEVVASVPRGTR